MPPFDAYLDWERYFRELSVAARKEETEHEWWAPVLVRLTPKPGQSYTDLAHELRERATDKNSDDNTRLLIDTAEEETLSLLKNIEKDDPASDLGEVRLILFRPEDADEHDPEEHFVEIRRGVPVLVDEPGVARFVPPSRPPEKDRGVEVFPVIGVIDDGIPYLHGALGRIDDSCPPQSRALGVWLQSFRNLKNNGTPLVAGQILKPCDIVPGECDERASYRAKNSELYLRTDTKTSDHAASHGAHVLELACRDLARDLPELRVAAVQLPPASVLDTSGKRLDHNILQGVRWIMARALRREGAQANDRVPLVINVSFGTSAGPKDGTGFLEEALRDEIRRYQTWARLLGFGTSPMRVVMAFGNGYRESTVSVFNVGPDEPETIEWRVQPDDRTASYLEIRLPASASTRLSVRSPGGECLSYVCIGEKQDVDIKIKDVVMGRLYRQSNEGSGSHAVASYVVALRPTRFPEDELMPASVGAWEVEVCADTPAQVIAQVQRDDTPFNYRPNGRQSYLSDPRAAELDGEVRSYIMPGPDAPITRRGTHSEQISPSQRPPGAPPQVDSDGLYAVGAVYARPWRYGCPPMARYSAAGSSDPGWTNTAAPSLSAAGEESHGYPGILGTGVVTGSTARLGGTSVAAPQVARELLRVLSGDMPPLNAQAEITALLETGAGHCSPEVLGEGLAKSVLADDKLRRGHGALAQWPRQGGVAREES